jgi:hypothetical protein
MTSYYWYSKELALHVGKPINPLWFWLLVAIVLATVAFLWFAAKRNPNPVAPKNAPLHQPK